MAINLMNKNKGAGTRIRRMFCCLEKRENEKKLCKRIRFWFMIVYMLKLQVQRIGGFYEFKRINLQRGIGKSG